MADTKSKKNSSKVFDVAKPGKSAPTATSKPVIVTHRPVLQDPMVVNIEVTDDAKPLASPSEVRRKVQIVPLHDADGNDIAPGAPVVEATAAPKKDEATDGSLVLDLPPEVTGEKAKTAEETETTSAPEVPEEKTVEDKPAKSSKKDEDKPAKISEAEEKPKAEPETPATPEVAADAKDNKTSDETPAEAAPEEVPEEAQTEPTEPNEQVESSTPPAEKEVEETNDFGLMPEPDAGDEGQTNPDAVKQKAEEEAKKIVEEQEKIIASGTYYLPIDAVAHRRAVHHTMIGIILVLLFGVLLFLAALDAEMLTINGFPAPTDYL